MPTTRPKGKRRYQVLAAIKQNRHATYRDLCHVCGLKTTSHLHYYLQQLKDEGLIQWEPKLARAITLPGEEPIVRMDPRKNNNQEIHAKKSAAGRKGKGVDALTSKTDPYLQERIDQVVAKAFAKVGTGVDVVQGYPRYSLKASRLG
jgi:hypothetical protein